jgi:hypothetical protein
VNVALRGNTNLPTDKPIVEIVKKGSFRICVVKSVVRGANQGNTVPQMALINASSVVGVNTQQKENTSALFVLQERMVRAES